jgi:2'-5' RNA ligase
VRLFFALQPDQQTAMRIASWRDRQFSQPGRPVPPANLHVTLAFIGEVQPRSLEALCSDVDQWCEKAMPGGGSFQLDQTGYWHRPGIYWLGPSHWPDSLQDLAEGLRTIAVRSGGKRERKRFQPHVTLFRGCEIAPPAPSALPRLPFEYSDFCLYESIQGRRGVTYQALAHWALSPRE